MVLLGFWNNRPITLNSKANCLTLNIESGENSTVVSFDLEGRLWTAMFGGVSYRCGLDGKIVAKWSDLFQNRFRKWLSPEECDLLREKIQSLMMDLLNAYQANQIIFQSPLSSSTIDTIQASISFDKKRQIQTREIYHQIYKPVGILPPDQYFSVVLQATEGCSFNTCTFCEFYKGRKFHIKSPQEFSIHCDNVLNFLGKGLSLRRTIFLGDANALVLSMPKIIPIINIIHQKFNIESLGGIFAFLDGFSGEHKTVRDYKILSENGIKRIYIGMESGNDELLSFLHKPGTSRDLIKTVQNIKQGGIAVGIIVLLGAGGKKYYDRHIIDTSSVINQMDLGMDDIIYFSELVESEGMQYTKDAFQAKLEPLGDIERNSQQVLIENSLVFSELKGTPHISRYDIREFVY